MKCWYWRNGCTFEGTEEDVEEHVDYMIKVDDDEHRMREALKKKVKPPQFTTNCREQPRLKFDQIAEEFHLTCVCTLDENLGQEPYVADIVFAWEKHSAMRRRVGDTDD